MCNAMGSIPRSRTKSKTIMTTTTTKPLPGMISFPRERPLSHCLCFLHKSVQVGGGEDMCPWFSLKSSLVAGYRNFIFVV
jgi:hypothetical protein